MHYAETYTELLEQLKGLESEYNYVMSRWVLTDRRACSLEKQVKELKEKLSKQTKLKHDDF